MKKETVKQLFNKSTQRVHVLGFSLFMIFAVSLSIYYAAVISPNLASAFTATGAGTGADPYRITNCQQLQEMKEKVNSVYVLTNDIDCSDTYNWDNGKGFEPLNSFTGTLDGRNYAIKDLYINRPDSISVGLFFYAHGGSTIRNLNLTKSPSNNNRIDITGRENVGALAGEFRGNVISNVHSELNVQTLSLDENGNGIGSSIGGLVGMVRAYVNTSSSSGKLTIAKNNKTGRHVRMGGLVGIFDLYGREGASLSINDSYSTAELTMEVEANLPHGQCGGLAGEISTHNTGDDLTVKNSYAAATINCSSPEDVIAVGGFVGFVGAGNDADTVPKLENNFAAGPTTALDSNHGFYGVSDADINSNYPDLSTNKFDASTTGQENCGPNENTDCTAVNIDDTQPDYFTSANNDGFFDDWNQTLYWQLGSSYPTFRQQVVMPSAPTNLQVSRDGDDFKLTWVAPVDNNGRASDIDGYKIEYQNLVTNSAWATATEDTGDTEATVQSLTIPGRYSFRVRAISSPAELNSINGLYSGVTNIATGMPADAPTNLSVQPKAKSVEVNWDEVVSATNYLVEYRKVGASSWSKAAPGAIDSNDNTKATLYQLDPEADYEVRITGSNVAGFGPTSTPTTFATLSQNRYNVANCQQLQEVSADLEGIYTQTANIDCSNQIFIPIGLESAFTGAYNGNGFKISNLSIDSELTPEISSFSGVGLFSTVIYADLQNIIVENSSIAASYQLPEDIDSDQNGLPDAPVIATPDELPIPNQIPTTEEDFLEVTEGVSSTAQQVLQAYMASSNSLAALPMRFAKISAGAVAGTVIGSGTYSNLQANNVVVQGAISGGIFGAVIPFLDFTHLGNIEDLTAAPPLTLNNLKSSGVISGHIGGGLIGIGTSSLASFINGDGALVVQNSTSSSEVQATIGGGLMGAGVSFALGNLVGTIASENTPAIKDSILTTFETQDVVIKNSTSTGLVSSCEAPSNLRVGVLGGVVGMSLGASIESSSSSGEVKVCGSTTSNFGMYGGASGGIGGVMLMSKVTNSHASGGVTAINDSLEGQAASPDVFIGATGGIAGVFFAGGRDSNGEYAISNSYNSGDIEVYTKSGGVIASGGINGITFGSPTIKSSYNSGNITHVQPAYNVSAASTAGGVTGLAFGFDVPWFAEAGPKMAMSSSEPTTPTHSLNIDNTYNTGDINIVKQGSGGIAGVSGGIAGLFIGNGTISNSHSTGSMGNNLPNNINVDLSAQFLAILGNNSTYGTTTSGGIIGTAIGLDIPALFSNVAGGVIFKGQGTPIVKSQGLIIDSSYSSGNIKANIAGGTLGNAEGNIKVNKVYNSGNITGTITGGLIGQSGLLSSAGIGGFTYFAASLFEDLPSSTTLEQAKPFADLFDGAISDGIGRVEVGNSYSSGSVTGVVGELNMKASNGESVENYTPGAIPTVAGGLAGLFMAPAGSITNSYASGDVNISADPSIPTPDEDDPKLAKVPSVAGGIIGIDLGLPNISINNVLESMIAQQQTPGNDPHFIKDYVGSPQKVENVFSVSKLNLQSDTFTGGSVGLFISPLTVLDGVLFGNTTPSQETNDKLYSFKNIYVDKTKFNVAECSGPEQSLTQKVNQISNDSNYPVRQENGDVRDLTPEKVFSDDTSPIFDQLIGDTACQYVNNNNSQPQYFINNKTNAPMNTWNFSNVWYTQRNDYPKFVAGATTNNEPDDDGGDGPGGGQNPGSSTTTTVNPTVTIQNRNTPVEFRNNIKEIARKMGVVRDEEQVKGLKAILARMPVFLAKSIPYSLVLFLLILAALYSWQALREYQLLNQYHKNIVRITNTKEAIDSYLAITTHYLNTPVAIMGGAVELLVSLKKVSETKAASIQKKIKTLSERSAALLSANQVSNAQSVNDEKLVKHVQPNPIKAKAVWIPASIALILILMANALFIYADIFNSSPYRIAVELFLYALGVLLVALAYSYRNFMEATKEVAKQQLAMESKLYKRRQEFIPEAVKVVEESYEELQIASESTKKIPESKLFFNGLAMLGEIKSGLSKIKKFSEFDGPAPLFDITTYVQKSVHKFKEQAEERHITFESNVAPGLVSRIQPEEIKQIVDSLIDNAVKFSKDGGHIKVNVSRRFNKLVLAIEDEGIGISEQKLPSLLKPFSRVTDTLKYDYQGMGLGLYTNKVVINRLGGNISIKSKLGQGTLVTVSLPLSHDVGELAPVLIVPEAAA